MFIITCFQNISSVTKGDTHSTAAFCNYAIRSVKNLIPVDLWSQLHCDTCHTAKQKYYTEQIWPSSSILGKYNILRPVETCSKLIRNSWEREGLYMSAYSGTKCKGAKQSNPYIWFQWNTRIFSNWNRRIIISLLIDGKGIVLGNNC